MGLPSTEPPKSAMANFTAATSPGPVFSAYGPDMSSSTPILTALFWEYAGTPSTQHDNTAARAVTR
jgi:hypothetical protein